MAVPWQNSKVFQYLRLHPRPGFVSGRESLVFRVAARSSNRNLLPRSNSLPEGKHWINEIKHDGCEMSAAPRTSDIVLRRRLFDKRPYFRSPHHKYDFQPLALLVSLEARTVAYHQ